MSAVLRVVNAGPLTTVQDLGRPGYAHLGVTRSGALDVASHLAANRAVGNPDGAATLETTLGGCLLRASEHVVVAVTGAPCDLFAGDIPAPFGRAFHLAAGQTLEVGAARAGVRSYVAVRGGIDVEPVLGSRSTCLLTGLGPEPLAAGAELPVGANPGPAGDATLGDPGGRSAVPGEADEVVLTLLPGPRDDWFGEGGLVTLASSTFVVTTDSNRVGLRLDGPPLQRTRDGELESEPMVLGAVQVPPSGLPIVFLADHPTTGGYPVIGVVDDAGIAACAQARPGTRVRFVVRPPT